MTTEKQQTKDAKEKWNEKKNSNKNLNQTKCSYIE